MRFKTVWLPVLLVATAGCNGHSGTLTSTPSVSGAYEFVVTSDVTGGTTLVEANLVANGNKSSATGPAGVQVLTLESKNWYVNGICYGTTPGRNSVTADTNGSNIALIFDDGECRCLVRESLLARQSQEIMRLQVAVVLT